LCAEIYGNNNEKAITFIRMLNELIIIHIQVTFPENKISIDC